VGRPHGRDGSFHVLDPRPALLCGGGRVTVGVQARTIVRRAGTDARPIVRLEGCDDRDAAEALRGQELRVATADAPALGEDEWWARDLEGCRVVDGARAVGVVRAVRALPSCEALEVVRADGTELLVPLVRDAVRRVDVAGREVEVSLAFLEGAPPVPEGATARPTPRRTDEGRGLMKVGD
jgi:16S rRNA processing protein RimM